MSKAHFKLGSVSDDQFTERPIINFLRNLQANMDNKYQIPKNRKPETKAEMLQHQIEELVKRRDNEKSPAAKQTINSEITKLFAQYERLKL